MKSNLTQKLAILLTLATATPVQAARLFIDRTDQRARQFVPADSVKVCTNFVALDGYLKGKEGGVSIPTSGSRPTTSIMSKVTNFFASFQEAVLGKDGDEESKDLETSSVQGQTSIQQSVNKNMKAAPKAASGTVSRVSALSGGQAPTPTANSSELSFSVTRFNKNRNDYTALLHTRIVAPGYPKSNVYQVARIEMSAAEATGMGLSQTVMPKITGGTFVLEKSVVKAAAQRGDSCVRVRSVASSDDPVSDETEEQPEEGSAEGDDDSSFEASAQGVQVRSIED